MDSFLPWSITGSYYEVQLRGDLSVPAITRREGRPTKLRNVRFRTFVVDQARPRRSVRSDRLQGRYGRTLGDDAGRPLARDLVRR